MADEKTPEELARLFEALTTILNATSEAVAKATAREVKIGHLVDKWLEQAVDDNLLVAVRVTYLECATEIIDIFNE